jgi:SAM-dependent methyltransferase
MITKIEEVFKPIKHEPPTNFYSKIKYFGRMILDLQILTIHNDLKKELPKFNGKVLDIGCGNSPYKHMLNKSKTIYYGIDVNESVEFEYFNPNVIYFDGEKIPFSDESFDAIICTEVFEHVYNFQRLANEMHRVCKPNAKLIITIPFSARFHYIPHDYFRYTPSALEKIFSNFHKIEVKNRGTDVLSICSKIIVLFFRNIIPDKFSKLILLPFWILSSPFICLIILIAHLCYITNIGSNLDPIGYTIKLIK